MKQSHSWALAVLVILILSIFLSFIPSVISFICLWSSETLSISSHCDVYVAARAYLLGYNCADEKELEAALRFCWTKYCSYSSGCFYCQRVSKFYFLNVQGLLDSNYYVLCNLVLDWITECVLTFIALVAYLSSCCFVCIDSLQNCRLAWALK